MRLYFLVISMVLMFLQTGVVFAQLVYTDPAFPTDQGAVVVYFNSNEGNGGLANYSGDVYAHTGVITSASVSSSDWKYVKTGWGQNTPETKLTKIGPNLYSLDVGPSVRAFYGVPAGEEILQMAFVFRSDLPVNNGSYYEGKTAAGGDIFIDIFKFGLNLSLNKPAPGFLLVEPGDSIHILLRVQAADSLFLFLNDSLIASGIGDSLQYDLVAGNGGKSWVKGLAKDSLSSVADSFYYFVRPPLVTVPLPAGVRPGVNVTGPNEVILCLYAPAKDFVFVIGDFTDWELDTSAYMARTPDLQHYWMRVEGLDPSKEYIYQYLVDGELRIGDPYTQKVSDPWNDSWIPASTYPGLLSYPAGKTSGIASVVRIQEDEYVWKTTGFSPPTPEKMVVYELLVRDFSEKHNFQGVIDSLAYLKRLGVNAVELMPVNEFEGNNSWGYNPNYYFAVDKYYGRKNDLKRLIDTLHSLGIAVILDVVYNHTFGSGPYVQLYWDKANNRPSAASPFYNMTARHDFNVGFDMNHESAATRRLVGRALKFWLEEFRVDGYRFDLSKGFTQKNTLGNPSAMAQYDASRIAILSGYADTVWSVNPQAYVILEHFAENTEEVELQSRGMMLWSNHNHAFAEGTMGYNGGNKSDLSWMSWLNRGFAAPRAIGYAESHDEERLMYKALQWGASSGGYDVKDSVTALQRMQLSALFLLGLPGPRMIWQFGELGYDYSIDYNGRTGEKPIRWDYFGNKQRRSLYSFYAAMNALRAGSATFHTQDFDVSVVGAVKSIVLRHPGMNAVIVGNFDVKEQEAELNFPSEGIWYDHFSGDSLKLKTTSYTIDLAPGQFHLFTDKKLEPSTGVEPIWRLPPQFEQGMLHIYPNPSAGDISFYLELPDGKEGKASLELSDLAGRRVGSIELTVKGRVVVPLSDLGLNLAVGTYLCTFSFDGRSETEKLIIK